MKRTLVLLLLAGLLALNPSLSSAQSYKIDWCSINSGGGLVEASGSYKINGTVGQSVAGIVTTPPYSPDPCVHYVGFWSGDMRTPTLLASVEEAKCASNGEYVCLSGTLYSTCNYSTDFGDRIYVEAGDRSQGIQYYHGLSPIASVVEGDRVSIIGTVTTLDADGNPTGSNGEKAIKGSTVIRLETHSPLRALGLQAISMGGGHYEYTGSSGQQGVCPYGLNNVGLLMRVWATVQDTVTESDGKTYLLVDDGSRYDPPLRVDASKLGAIADGAIVQVTGISSVGYIDSQFVPVLRPRRSGDVAVIWTPP